MALFSLKKIASLAQHKQAYLRGVSLYNAAKVKDICRVHSDFYAEFITANVQENAEDTFSVEVGFAASGEAEWLFCNCGLYKEGEGACRHIVAALTDKYYKDMLGGLTPASKLPTVFAQTGEAAKNLLRIYPQKDTVALRAAENTGDIALIPTLVLSGLRPLVSFTVGKGRQYIVRDISAFTDAVLGGETVSYGKDFSFFHHPSAFTRNGREMLRFLLSEVSAYQGNRPPEGRELPLSSGGFERLLALIGDAPFTVRVGGDGRAAILRKGDPAVSITAEKLDGGVKFKTTPAIPVVGASRLYVLVGDTLHRCSADFASRAQDWLIAAHHERDGIVVAFEDLSAFCSQVLPAVREVMPINNEELLAEYMPETAEPKVYLHTPEEGTVTAKVDFCYPEKTVPLFTDIQKSERRDARLERAVRVEIERYFTGFLPETGEVVFHGDEDAIYRFLTEGLPALEALATVYASDDFKRLRPSAPPDVSVGVRVEGNLLQMDIDLDGWEKSELAELLSRFRAEKPYTRLKSGAYISLDDETVQGLALLAEELELTPAELKSGKISLPRYRALQLQSLLQSRQSMPFRQDKVFLALTQTLKDASKAPAAVPPSLEDVLRPYQKEGFRWLHTLTQAGFGGILADDMGLGKTVQIISLLLDDTSGLPSLVVCPTSLVLNWENEIKKFAPTLSTLAVTGNATVREQLISTADAYRVVITSYDMLKRDILLYKNMRFRYHILDEAQYIKNQKTQNAKAVKAIVSEQRFALTGTPIENRLSELWSIFDFLMPGFLYSYNRFKTRFELPAVRDGDQVALKRLAAIVSPFLMRRLKTDVLTELPPKTEQVLVAQMGEEQQKLYSACAAQIKNRIDAEISAGTFEKSKLSVLTLLMRLRQICCDPALCTENYASGSCKREACLELLTQAKAAGHRVLLFSQFTSMLDILENDLKNAGISYMVLKGSTPAAQRARMVNEFNAGKGDVFLISLKAGGTGLNLTGADTVIHFDPWWNLAAEQQATDRAHRIGQRNPVQVVRLVAKDSVEEKIIHLQQEKAHLADAILSEGVSSLSALSAEDLLGLL